MFSVPKKKQKITISICCRNRSEPVNGRATNNVGEIQAATMAIHLAGQENIQQLCIRTDSSYLCKAATNWIYMWIENGWRKANRRPVENQDDFRQLKEAMDTYGMDLKWEHVPGHSGIPGNECADQLAKQGAQRYGYY